jgi:hypothetical protein
MEPMEVRRAKTSIISRAKQRNLEKVTMENVDSNQYCVGVRCGALKGGGWGIDGCVCKVR